MKNKRNIDLTLPAEQLRNALSSLKSALDTPADEDRFLIDASIQRFEYSIELFWKFLKKILQREGRPVQLPREILKESFQAHLIDNEQIWIDMLIDRNQTSHTYNEDLADEIYQRIKTTHLSEMLTSFESLVKKYEIF
ncbi:MAG: nucleotidyltransferase [Rickettsiales bacterium]|nr:MAG: nucleotidyltransferase [Rickettsiales bacterium]